MLGDWYRTGARLRHPGARALQPARWALREIGRLTVARRVLTGHVVDLQRGEQMNSNGIEIATAAASLLGGAARHQRAGGRASRAGDGCKAVDGCKALDG